MNTLTITNTPIRRDGDGRYCLHDLHQAAGGEPRHRPHYWLEIQQTKDLVAAIGIAGITAIQSKQGLGTFVAKELVYAYAMWISAVFHLQVIRAYDTMVAPPALMDLRDPASLAAYAMQLTAITQELQGKVLLLENRAAVNDPKAEALDRFAATPNARPVRESAKVLKVTEASLYDWLRSHDWTYRTGDRTWQGYADYVKRGDVTHRLIDLTKCGHHGFHSQVMITNQGLAKIARLMGKSGSQLDLPLQ
jgi:phage antirepressor YoqD-like protein